jgi:para-nitrobenzyl esterase
MMQKQGGKAYLYYFTRVPPRPDREKLGAYHAAEIVYVFDNLKKTTWNTEPGDVKLAETMSSCWTRFAAGGDPNGGQLPAWQPYRPDGEPYLQFGDTIEPGRELLKAECDFFDAYMAMRRSASPP